MKTYKVNVNGTQYQISIELMSEEEAKKAQEVPAAKSAETAPVSQNAGEGAEVTAPMQGTILSVKVKEGESVSKGQVLFILEAMKMENEIVADGDGVIASINVNKGDSVETGAVVATIS